MRNHYCRTSIALALALLVLAPVAALAAPDKGDDMEKTELIGQLAQDDSGAYVLVEQESGETIQLVSGADLSEHVGSTVTVKGEWTTDAEGEQVFKVSECRREA